MKSQNNPKKNPRITGGSILYSIEIMCWNYGYSPIIPLQLQVLVDLAEVRI